MCEQAAQSLRGGLIDRTPIPLKTPATGESSQVIAKLENSEDRPGLEILIHTMGKGRGPDCCGACSCGICCAVIILLAGVITWACVWGIEYNPNVKQRRAQSGEAKKKTRVISQWENVNCDAVFYPGCTNCLEDSPSPTGPCQQSNGLCWALDGEVCPTGTTLC